MNVLVADDDPVFQKLLPGLLKSWGYEVTVARDGDEAWRYLQSDDGLRLAIVDWIMPGVDGLELCRRIRDARRSNYIYILLMTATKESRGLLTVMEAGADDYLTKPFDPQELRLRLRAGCRVLESEERYRVIAQTASDGILTTDETGRIQFANTAAASIFGFTSPDLIDRDFESLAPGSLGRCESVADYGYSSSAIELTGRHRTGREIPLEISVSECLQGPQNHRLTVVIRDITERRRTERQAALSQKLESIGQLAAGVAHEINTPIQYIGDNLNFLSDSWNNVFRLLTAYQELPCSLGLEAGAPRPPESIVRLSEELDMDYLRLEIPKAIQQSLDGVRRVSEIVGAMKELSHPGSAVKTAVDLNHAIKNTIVVSKNAWKYVADLTVELDADLPAVQCIAGDIHQVVLNLIINAADAISDRQKDGDDAKGQIVVSTRREGDWVEIRVRDTGMGIPEVIQPRIFDPFFTTKGVGKGTGQGLAIAHAIIVQKHQGSIHFETERGVGTTFVIRLLVGTDEAGSQTQTPDSLEAKYAG